MEFVDKATLGRLQGVLWDTHREIEVGAAPRSPDGDHSEGLPLEHHKTLADLHALLEQAEVLLQELLSAEEADRR